MRLFRSGITSLVSLLAAVTIGCGGGGGGGSDTPAVVGQVANNNVNNTVVTPAAVPQTFTFPSFNNNSRLAVIANFQTTQETPNQTGNLSVQVANALGGIAPRMLLSDGDTEQTNRCGYADVCALNHLLEETGGIRAQGVPGQIRPRFQDLAAGAQEQFFLVPAFREVTGQKILEPNETTHCTIFAEVINNQPVLSEAKARQIAEAFDSNNPQRTGSGIYDQVRAVFGSEWNQNPAGGNDGDQKVVLFFFSSATLGPGLFGFVSPADGNPNGGATSNKGEIVYINADKDIYQTLATLSHEFQHLVNQNEKVNQQGANPSGATDENITVNEGLSGLAEEVCGYTFESGNTLLALVTNDYLEKPEDHEFFDFFETGLAYGQGYLFFKYVREHFGDQTIRAICTSTDTGLSNLNTHLPGGFAEIFRRWTIANYATNLGGAVPSIYRYPSGFRTDGNFAAGQLVGVNTSPLADGSTTGTGSLKPWSASYLILENRTGTGLTTTVTPANGSPFGVIFEQTSDQFTAFDD